MKLRVLFALTVFILATSGLRAQAPDTLAPAPTATPPPVVTNLARTVDTLRNQQAALAARQHYLDSATVAAIDTSFSRALAEARLHPERLYNRKTSGVLSAIAYALLALFLFFAFYYFFTTALCRNESFQDDCKLKPVQRRPFSYSRVQLFWWTVIILFCYIWFYAAYNILLPLNPTVVILLGSGLAVYIFGKSIDNNQIAKNNVHKPTRHQDIEDSQGFLTDILSDDNGVSIHRLQAVAFDLIFGLGFLGFFFTSAASHRAYPFIDFEPWQFSLLGISAVGYLGVKANENPPSTIGNRRAMKERETNDPISGRSTGASTSNTVTTTTTETPVNPRVVPED